jgi:SHS2 domain-containing protein
MDEPSKRPTGPDATPPWLRQVEHAADVCILVEAGSLPELFARAAWAMFSLLTDLSQVRPLQAQTVVAVAEDREELLVRWLSELNFRHVTRRELFCHFEVCEMSDKLIRAQVLGEKTDLERHVVHTEIKAVTFHQLRIEQRGQGWEAQVLFDL